VNGRGVAADAPRPRSGRRYTALALLFLLPLVWIALGSALVAAGLRTRSQVEPLSGWLQTTGWVAGFHVDQSAADKGPNYTPVIAFRAAGHVVTFSAPEAPAPPAVGSRVRVAYDPRDLADAHDLSLGSSWEGQFYLGIGFLVLGIALAAFLYWLVFVRLKSAGGTGRARTGPSEGRHVRSG
jgi:hypothetical protein